MAGYNFRVLLDSVKNDEVFRDILIHENLNFEQFYMAILDAFDMDNDQMASFFVSNEQWDKGEEISLLNMFFDGVDKEVPPIEMNKLALKERVKEPMQRFILVHDFLSMWIFLIELREVVEEVDEMPQLTMSVGEVPEKMRQEGANSLDDFKFDADFVEGGDDFYPDDFDDLDGDYFDGGYDDFDF